MGKKSVGILIGVAAVVAVLGGTGYYFRDDIRQMIPIFDDGSSEDKVYVERVVPYAQAGMIQLVREKGELVSLPGMIFIRTN